jgi:hypothetical protein
MPTVIPSFVALLATPDFQVAFDQRFERTGGHVIVIAGSEQWRARDIAHSTAPRPEQRPKAS